MKTLTSKERKALSVVNHFRNAEVAEFMDEEPELATAVAEILITTARTLIDIVLRMERDEAPFEGNEMMDQLYIAVMEHHDETEGWQKMLDELLADLPDQRLNEEYSEGCEDCPLQGKCLVYKEHHGITEEHPENNILDDEFPLPDDLRDFLNSLDI